MTHKLASFINLFGFRIKRQDFYLKFMEFMFSTPFEDDILGIKLCVQLFVKEEYAKLY